MNSYEVVFMVDQKITRKGVVAADMIVAINKALPLVPGATAANAQRVIFLGVIDAT